jgi:hypothetical protein
MLIPKRGVLAWPEDAAAATAAAVAEAAAAHSSELSIIDESWMPVGIAALLVTAYDEVTLQTILNFVSASGSGSDERGARYIAGMCSGSTAPSSIKTGEQFLIFENGISYDDDFGTVAALQAVLHLPGQGMVDWQAPVYSSSL